MQTKRRDLFTTVRTEGATLPADLLQRVAEGNSGLEGLRLEDYHLSGEKLNEAVNRAWNRLLGAWKAFHTAREKLPENDPATSATREKWLLPLFRELDYGRLPPHPGRGRRRDDQPAQYDPGIPEPQRRPPLGVPFQRRTLHAEIEYAPNGALNDASLRA